jgi:hypothetical protein
LGLLINAHQKWAFVHIPKTGGTSVSKVLGEMPNTKNPAGHDSLRIIETNLSEYFKFTLVRNPFTRLASAYFHEIRKTEHMSFEHFLKNSNEYDLWFLNQTYYTHEGCTKDKQMNYIGRYENYKDDVAYLLNKIGIDSNIPHLNRNPIYDKHPQLNQQKYYKHLYSEKWMKDWVRERYYNDFKIFNYGMEI